jgi:hypothetical protein
MRTADIGFVPEPSPPASAVAAELRDKDAKILLDELRKEAVRVRQGVVPIAIQFPSIGPSIFLESELTAEAQSPSIALRVRQTGGGR